MKKRILSLLVVFALGMMMAGSAMAQLDVTNNMGDVPLGPNDPVQIITQIITIVLAFLGLIAVIIILLGGFKWMTAGGNEDKVGEAKKMMTQGLIGLIIILAAYGIASFVIEKALDVTGAST